MPPHRKSAVGKMDMQPNSLTLGAIGKGLGLAGRIEGNGVRGCQEATPSEGAFISQSDVCHWLEPNGLPEC